jgi:hypothetical protein
MNEINHRRPIRSLKNATSPRIHHPVFSIIGSSVKEEESRAGRSCGAPATGHWRRQACETPAPSSTGAHRTFFLKSNDSDAK